MREAPLERCDGAGGEGLPFACPPASDLDGCDRHGWLGLGASRELSEGLEVSGLCTLSAGRSRRVWARRQTAWDKEEVRGAQPRLPMPLPRPC